MEHFFHVFVPGTEENMLVPTGALGHAQVCVRVWCRLKRGSDEQSSDVVLDG